MLERVGLPAEYVLCAMSAHAGSVRRALASFGWPLKGCTFHFLQLSINHVLPPMRQEKQAAVEREGVAAEEEAAEDSTVEGEVTIKGVGKGCPAPY